MQTTLKRIDVGSAFRVGIVLYGLIFAVFGLFFVAFQGLFLSALSSGSFTVNGDSFNPAAFMGAGILSLLCFYVFGVVAGAIFGGIQCAILAWLYNLTAHWIGGIKVVLETPESDMVLDDLMRDTEKRKRDEPPL
jgi:hypothetical protein